MGRSLAGPGQGEAIALTYSHASVQRGRLRLLQRRWAQPAEGRLLLYDRVSDPFERSSLPIQIHSAFVQAADAELSDLRLWMRHLYGSGEAVRPPEPATSGR